MKQGGAKAASGGFTIVETLIVLAVTGILLASAVTLISGKQNKTEFQTAINNFQQQLQQVINETSSGFYSGDISCTASSGAVSTVSTGANPTGQCIFVGKAIQFGSDTDPSQIISYPLVGSVRDISGAVNTDVRATNPVAVAANNINPNIIDASSAITLNGGLTIPKPISYTGMHSGLTGVLAFLAGDNNGNFASANATTHGLNSGAQQFSLYAVNSTAPNMQKLTAADDIDNKNNLVPVTDAAQFCVQSGTTNQSALVTVTAGLTVSITKIVENICP